MQALPRRLSKRKKPSDSSLYEIPLHYVVIGGGIAGVSCAKEIARLQYENDISEDVHITLISAGDLLKETSSVIKLTNLLEEIQVYEKRADQFYLDNPAIQLLQHAVTSIDTTNKRIFLDNDTVISFDKLCVCTGSIPKPLAVHRSIITLRDLQSVDELVRRLVNAKHVAIVGNGGIAMELVHALTFCDVSWIAKDRYVGATFLDATASVLLEPTLHNCKSSSSDLKIPKDNNNDNPTAARSGLARASGSDVSDDRLGYGLGPEWIKRSGFWEKMRGSKENPSDLSRSPEDRAVSSESQSPISRNLRLYLGQEIVGLRAANDGDWQTVHGKTSSESPSSRSNIIREGEWINEASCPAEQGDDEPSSVRLQTSTGDFIACDFVVSATGVVPHVPFAFTSTATSELHGVFHHREDGRSPSARLAVDAEGALIVDQELRTVHTDVFAAGDCCHCVYEHTRPQEHSHSDGYVSACWGNWHQQKLWSQARTMGTFAAQSMCGALENHAGDNVFKLFAHVTRFFGFKVVLLGRYNGQGMEDAVIDEIKNTILISNSTHSSPPAISQSHTQKIVSFTQMEQCQGENEAPLYCIIAEYVCDADPEVSLWVRFVPGQQYIKMVIHRGRLVGALVLGDTDLEEVFENLILNEMVVSGYGSALLDPNVDVESYFD